MFLQVRFFSRLLVLIVSALLAGPFAQAQLRTFELDPAQTKVDFTVDSTLHTVHGTFQLKSGRIQFDSATGQASGELVVDSASGQSGSDGRDKRMHKEILESPKYSDIIFTPQHVKGTVAVDGKSLVDMEGLLTLHGQVRPLTMTIHLDLQGGAGVADCTFDVPYQKWGMKNPSTFILRVDNKVKLHVQAVGRFMAGPNRSQLPKKRRFGLPEAPFGLRELWNAKGKNAQGTEGVIEDGENLMKEDAAGEVMDAGLIGVAPKCGDTHTRIWRILLTSV
jgi:polyisoprenoid-binding protein YceI